MFALDQTLYRLRDVSGITGVRVSSHTLEHTVAKMTMELPGADAFKLKELMGHSSIQTTLNYLKDFQQREARRGLNPLDELGKRRRADDDGGGDYSRRRARR